MNVSHTQLLARYEVDAIKNVSQKGTNHPIKLLLVKSGKAMRALIGPQQALATNMTRAEVIQKSA